MSTSAPAPPDELPPLAAAILAAIGHTPLVELPIIEEVNPRCRLFGKLESSNPGGSIKDRPVARMITHGYRRGAFQAGRRLLDSSSGNAGISYAMIGAALGLPITIVVPGNASRERLDRIAAHGAELITTDPIQGYDFALREARRLATEQPDRYWYCDQYSNDDNWRAHYDGTAAEILQQTSAALGTVPDAFVGGVGTGGTITGVGRRLREANPDSFIVAVVPELFPGIEGLKPLGHAGDIVPPILDETLIDLRIPVTIDDALAVCHKLTRYGLFVGPSSGAYVHAAMKLAETGDFPTIVTCLNDTGERYGSTGMWQRR